MILIIDTETTGFSPNKHSLIDVGWIVTDNDLTPICEDRILIMPQAAKAIDPGACKVNGYTEDGWLRDGAVPLEDAREAFERKLTKSLGDTRPNAYAHSATFDKGFLIANMPFIAQRVKDWVCTSAATKAYCERKGIPVVGTVRNEETKEVISHGTATMGGLCKLAGVEYKRDAHGALEDCRLLLKAVQWLKAQGHQFPW